MLDVMRRNVILNNLSQSVSVAELNWSARVSSLPFSSSAHFPLQGTSASRNIAVPAKFDTRGRLRVPRGCIFPTRPDLVRSLGRTHGNPLLLPKTPKSGQAVLCPAEKKILVDRCKCTALIFSSRFCSPSSREPDIH